MKRIILAVLSLCVCFASVAWGRQPTGNCVNSWTEFHGANMQRWNPCEKTLGVNNVRSLRVKWHNFLGLGSAPAVANGIVYTAALEDAGASLQRIHVVVV